MSNYECLAVLTNTFHRDPAPRGRTVRLVARVVTKSPLGGVAHEFKSQDNDADVPYGGRVHAIRIDDPNLLEIATWNTGPPLKRLGTISHAENQFYEFIKDMVFTKVDVEITHSPCPGCSTMLKGLIDKKKIPAVLRWVTLYEKGDISTNRDSLMDLLKAGWKLEARESGIPVDARDLPITRI
jgi:hypothetical protein